MTFHLKFKFKFWSHASSGQALESVWINVLWHLKTSLMLFWKLFTMANLQSKIWPVLLGLNSVAKSSVFLV